MHERTPEQKNDYFRELTLNLQRENLLREVSEKIQICLPQLDELIRQAKAQEPKQGMEQSW